MRRFSGRALAFFAAVVILSDWAAAQQTGLFPLAPIRRRRPSCSQQDPVYKLYKDQYFGYHPTIWRRFPDGWGAPSPEGPDPAASFKKYPRIPPDAMYGDEGYEDEQDMPAEPGPRPALPNPPGEDDRSPFEMNEPAPAPNGNRPRDPDAEAPPAGAEPSPFERPGPRAGAPATPRPTAPDLSAPTPPVRTSRRGRPAEIDPADAGRPILAAPDATARIDASDSGLRDPSGSIEAPVAAPATVAAGSQPSGRRSRIGTLMSSLGWSSARR
jgi:hypothetical protein